MPLAPGLNLGRYEITRPIGAGGTGEVYKARDTRLDRTVAIKVLPEHLSNDPALRERFEREARAVSSLNHPHITVQYIAPEQLEGKDVDARADLFALGAMLFEMVTGHKAFEGESQASLISAIMSAGLPIGVKKTARPFPPSAPSSRRLFSFSRLAVSVLEKPTYSQHFLSCRWGRGASAPRTSSVRR